jgi:hypothetical protein
MICWAPQSARNSLLVAAALVALAAACAKPDRGPEAARPARAATLLPADLALGFLQEIKSQPGRSLLAGEATVPPCLFTDKGAWSGGEYRKLTGQRAPNSVNEYGRWILYKIEDPTGREITGATLDKRGAWNYSLRTPRTARTVFGTIDHCIIGPSGEPPAKVVEALSALGVEIAPDYAFVLTKK